MQAKSHHVTFMHRHGYGKVLITAATKLDSIKAFEDLARDIERANDLQDVVVMGVHPVRD